MKIFNEIRKYEEDFPVWTGEYENMGFLPHWHKEIELIYVKEGSTTVNISGKNFYAKKGDLIIVNSGETHLSPAVNANNTLNFMLIDPSLIKSYRPEASSHLICEETLIKSGLSEDVKNFFCETEIELNEKKSYYKDIMKAKISLLWYSVKRVIPEDNTENPKSKRSRLFSDMQNVLIFLSEHFAEEIPLSIPAEKLGLSECHFSRLFKKMLGISYTGYINMLRIENATRLLRENRESVLDIALSSGFNNIRTFNRVFKSITGSTPTEFLKQNYDFPESAYFKTSPDKINVENDSSVIVKA